MATTYTLQTPTGVAGNAEPTVIAKADLEMFTIADSSKTEQLQTADYIYSGGSAADLVTLNARRAHNPKTDKTNCSVRLTAFVKTAVSETGEITYEPLDVVIAWNHMGSYNHNSAHVLSMLQFAFGVVTRTTQLEGPSATVVDQFDHGIVTGIVDGLAAV